MIIRDISTDSNRHTNRCRYCGKFIPLSAGRICTTCYTKGDDTPPWEDRTAIQVTPGWFSQFVKPLTMFAACLSLIVAVLVGMGVIWTVETFFPGVLK